MKITLTFKYEGTRKNGRGMLQVLDNSCFEVSSNWILSTKFRLYDRNGSFASCSKKHNMFLRKIEATMIEESNQVMNINRMDHR